MPKMRWPTMVATVCSISSSERLSRKHRANRSINPTAWSAAPSNSPPASEVILPPSKAATTERPSTRANPNRSALHSVCIGTPPNPETTCCDYTIFSESEPRCTLSYEKSRLAPRISTPMAVFVHGIIRSQDMSAASAATRRRLIQWNFPHPTPVRGGGKHAQTSVHFQINYLDTRQPSLEPRPRDAGVLRNIYT